ncbi:MAG TPA: 2-amino-4-hydroxy-6-hydroxymethyldihydropteridine diphosphokinase [Gemmatimonadaceae bacterium]|nr:2-amino-4-hydroxy-6-hydroxymethyldihydropteridine diphosphokinase [Gemmatimonadaceae bacterium]
MPDAIREATRDVAYVALGSNLGDRHAMLAAARAALAALPDSRVLAESSIEETAPVGGVPQPAYLNQMIALETSLAPRALLAALQAIESSAGRTRDVRWGPRTLDLDIVCFERQTVRETDLTVPHPELPNRDFWQRELAELKSARIEGAP